MTKAATLEVRALINKIRDLAKEKPEKAATILTFWISKKLTQKSTKKAA